MMPGHRCPAPRCPNRVPAVSVACRYHWHELPPTIRAAILRGYKRHPGGTSHLAAIADAVRYWRAIAGSAS